MVSFVLIAHNLYIGLTQLDLYNHICVDRSDKIKKSVRLIFSNV